MHYKGRRSTYICLAANKTNKQYFEIRHIRIPQQPAMTWLPNRTLRFVGSTALYPKSAKHAFLQNAILIALYFFFAATRPPPVFLFRTIVLLIFVAEVPSGVSSLIRQVRMHWQIGVPRFANLAIFWLLFLPHTFHRFIHTRICECLLIFPAYLSIRSIQRLLDEVILRIRGAARSMTSKAWNCEASWYLFDIIWNETVIALGIVLLPFVLYWVYIQLTKGRASAVWICIWLVHLVIFSFSLEMFMPILPLYAALSALSIHLTVWGLRDICNSLLALGVWGWRV